MNQTEPKVCGIFIAPTAGAPMQSVAEVYAAPGGLAGDRYALQQGSFSRWPGPHRDVSLIAVEDLDFVKKEFGIDLEPSSYRRNILVQGVSVQDLIKKPFQIGDVRLRGERLCQPCKYLARLLGQPDLVQQLAYRAGIRARILTEGVVQVGDRLSY